MLLSFCSNGPVQICDSLNSTLSRTSKKCVQAIYTNCVDDRVKLMMSFLPVQKQSDGFNCGPFAIAYAAEILNGKSPIEAQFDAAEMCGHLISRLEKQSLLPFPKGLGRNRDKS